MAEAPAKKYVMNRNVMHNGEELLKDHACPPQHVAEMVKKGYAQEFSAPAPAPQPAAPAQKKAE